MVITVPIPGKEGLLVKEGEHVSFGTPLYKLHKQEEIRISLAQRLHIPPHKIFQHLKKFVGDTVKKGEVIAVRKSLFGSQSYQSEATGLIREVDHVEGIVRIEVERDEEIAEEAQFTGEIVEIEKNVLRVKVKEGKEYEAKELSAPFGGETHYPAHIADVAEEEVRGKVVVVDRLTSYNQIKLEALGAAGFVLHHPLEGEGEAPFAIVRQIADWEKVKSGKLPYCFADRVQCKIMFYR